MYQINLKKIVSYVGNQFKNSLLIRRILAFNIDLVILFLFALLFAYVIYLNENLWFLSKYSLYFILFFFVTQRLVLNGKTIGCKITKLEIGVYEGLSLRKIRIIYRTFFNIFIFLLPFEITFFLIDNISGINHVPQINVFIFSVIISLPIFSILILIQSKGTQSLSDVISGCYVYKGSLKSDEQRICITLYRKVFEYLIVLSLIYFTGLLLLWKYEPYTFFKGMWSEPKIINAINKIGFEEVYYRFTNANSLMNFKIYQDFDYSQDVFWNGRVKTLEMIISPRKSSFHDKNLHYQIAKYLRTKKLKYEDLYNDQISQIRLIIRNSGEFYPIKIVSDYTYLILDKNGGWIIRGYPSEDDLEKQSKQILLFRLGFIEKQDFQLRYFKDVNPTTIISLEFYTKIFNLN